MKKDKFLNNDDENSSIMDSNNSQATENDGDFYSNIFFKIPSLIPYKNEIKNSILSSQDKFFEHAIIDKKREIYILNGIEAAKQGLEKLGSSSSIFPTVFLFTKISDRVMSQTKEKINQEKYQLIYNSSLYVAAKNQSQYYNPVLFYDGNNEKKLLVALEDVKSYSNNIIKLLNFDLNIVSPTEILHIYQLVDGTLENEDLTKKCRFLLTFLLFSRVFLDQEKNMVVLTAYMYSKTIKFKQLIWREDFETLTGIKKKKIISNLEKLMSEIKKKIETYNLLYNNFYNII